MERLGYGVKAAAAALDVSERFIRAALADGRLEGRKIGRRTIVPAESLKALLQPPPGKQAKASAR